MIPLTDESAWLPTLAGLPPWQPPLVATVVVAPHPDDETLGAGGLIAWLRRRGIEVAVVAVTDGENCYAGEHLGMVREQEQERALACLGVASENIHRLHLPDSDVSNYEPELVHALQTLVPEGSHMVAPWRQDFHPDHEACGRAAQQVAADLGVKLSSYFFWTWHRGTPALLDGTGARRFVFDSTLGQAKREALSCHRSQLEHAGIGPILPEHLLKPAWRDFEVFLPS